MQSYNIISYTSMFGSFDWFSLTILTMKHPGYDVEIHKMLDFANPIQEPVIYVIPQTEIP